MIQQMTYIAAAVVFSIGLYGLVTERDMIKLCVCLSIMESALVMVFVAMAYRQGATAPILDGDTGPYVDPLPHALSLTTIVIGAGIISLALALSVMVYHHSGTTDIGSAFRRRR